VGWSSQADRDEQNLSGHENAHTQVPDKVTRGGLRRLSDWLDHDEDQDDEVSS
jgi:hypothetical protein